MTTATRRKAVLPVYGFKAASGPAGTFEAVVSVFGNVDLGGDRVQRGAFARTLEEWDASGDPIPVIFSHRWDDLDAHIGIVEEAAELAPGDERLPAELAANGGLWVKAALDIEEPFASRVFTLLERRSLREFSFAFDIAPNGARQASDGVTDLVDLNLHELGPTLKGMNPETALLNAKTLRLADVSGLTPAQVLVEATLKALELDAEPKSAGTITVDVVADTTKLRAALAELHAGESIITSAQLAELKVSGRPSGSLEETFLDPLRAAVLAWAADAYGSDLYAVHIDATFPDEERLVVIAERWEDPYGEGPLWELNYTSDEDGRYVIGAAQEVDAVITITPKERKLTAAKRAGSGLVDVLVVPAKAERSLEAAKALDAITRAELDLADD